MRSRYLASALAVMAALMTLAPEPADASAHARRVAARQIHAHAHARAYVRSAHLWHGGVGHGSSHLRGRLTAARRPSHYAPLVGDRAGGYGFYPLPLGLRIAAWRYRQRHAMQAASAIGFAVASTAVYSNWEFGEGFAHHHGVFNPIDGVGTPFFAGYYGGGDDDDPNPFPTAYRR